MRRVIVSLAVAASLMAPAAFAQQAAELTGSWRAEESRGRTSVPDYFSAILVERGGRVSGEGVINLCAGCRGWEQYDVAWEGRAKGDRVWLRGTYPDRPVEPELSFEGRLSADGQSVVGVVVSGRSRSEFLMQREAR